MAVSQVKRATRVAERVREELATTLAREISDPRLQGVMVSRVEMPDDLQMARVFVRLTSGADSPDAQRRLLAGLSAATRRLRSRLGANLGLRRTPELRFIYDEGLDATARIDELLNEIAEDKK